jgi:hypothetical protein
MLWSQPLPACHHLRTANIRNYWAGPLPRLRREEGKAPL